VEFAVERSAGQERLALPMIVRWFRFDRFFTFFTPQFAQKIANYAKNQPLTADWLDSRGIGWKAMAWGVFSRCEGADARGILRPGSRWLEAGSRSGALFFIRFFLPSFCRSSCSTRVKSERRYGGRAPHCHLNSYGFGRSGNRVNAELQTTIEHYRGFPLLRNLRPVAIERRARSDAPYHIVC